LFRLSSWVVVGCGSVCDPPLHLRPTQLVSLAAVCQQQAARCVLSAGFVPKLTIIEWCGRSFLYCVYPLCTAVIPVPVARLLSVFVHLVAPLTRYPVGGGGSEVCTLQGWASCGTLFDARVHPAPTKVTQQRCALRVALLAVCTHVCLSSCLNPTDTRAGHCCARTPCHRNYQAVGPGLRSQC
jgi:hypothetical protein